MLILNEKKYAEDLYLGKNTDVKSVVLKIGYITRYQLHILNYNDEENYHNTVKWMKKNHDNFDESHYSNLISDAIKKAHKNPFYHVDDLIITKTELDIISSLENLRAEKILFVLLCMAKQQSVANSFTNGLVRYSLPTLCKDARISVPADEREYILYNIVQRGFIGYPKKNNSQCLIVSFIDNEGETVLNLDEVDCQELAYVYLSWKNKGKGYTRCQKCNKLIKQSKTKPRKYCEECAKYEPVGEKTVVCVDCGAEFKVDSLNTKTSRCVECQEKANKERYNKYNSKRRGLTT